MRSTRSKALEGNFWGSFLLCYDKSRRLPLGRNSKKHCCDSLSNLYLCFCENNHVRGCTIGTLVVIRSQIFIFASAKTTDNIAVCRIYLLWFALKSLSLLLRKQPRHPEGEAMSGCDSLSNLYLCFCENNVATGGGIAGLLWFALKSLSLLLRKQPRH